MSHTASSLQQYLFHVDSSRNDRGARARSAPMKIIADRTHAAEVA